MHRATCAFVAACCIALPVSGAEPAARKDAPKAAEATPAATDAAPAEVTERMAGSWDFRFGLGFEPMLTDAHYELDDGTESDYDEWEASGVSLEFNATHRFASRSAHSAYLGAGAFLRGFGGSDDPDLGNDVGVGTLGLQVGGGWSWQATARYRLDVGPRLSLGLAAASEEICDGQGRIESESGAYGRFGVGANNVFNVGSMVFAVDAGIASWAAVANYDPATRSTVCGVYSFPGGDVAYSGAGGYLLGSIGFR